MDEDELRPGVVYRFFDATNALLYVGVTVAPAAGRLRQHSKESAWHVFAARVTEEPFADVRDADAAEIEAIVREKPIFNRRNNRTDLARSRLVDYLTAADRRDLLPLLDISPLSSRLDDEAIAILKRAERETGGNLAEMRRRLFAYALTHMPEDWRPAQVVEKKRRLAA